MVRGRENNYQKVIYPSTRPNVLPGHLALALPHKSPDMRPEKSISFRSCTSVFIIVVYLVIVVFIAVVLIYTTMHDLFLTGYSSVL